MDNLPTGTVTFLFTDIEGSTQISQERRATWEILQARHHAILRAAIETNNGYVFQVVGDALCAAFHRPGDAVRAALKAQRDFQAETWGEITLRVRMGIHTGVAEAEGQVYRGYLALSSIQRVMSAAFGGQVLLSQSAFDLIESDLPDEITLRDMGQHRLKDLLRPQHLYQLVAADLPCDFPPLKSLDARPHNLPIQLTSFVGRDKELTELSQLVGRTRLVTLTGVGGTGKTRLALQVAAHLLDDFKDGAWWINLGPLSDPALVPQAIASTLNVHEQPGRPLMDVLNDFLSNKELLLLLDNCEHLIEECARTADALIHAAGQTRILATSREPLGIAGEAIFRVRSLPLPAAFNVSTAIILQSDSVRLFIERAVAVKSDFQVSDQNASVIASICIQLDGIPLAIELAAARVETLGVEQIAARLDDRFRLLTGGARTALPRHRTLQAAVDWSYRLLSEAERVVLRRLSVFAGGWALEAAESVCASNGIDSDEVLDLLAQLVNKSLVIMDQGVGISRYRMLETIREYGREKLNETGEAESVRERHLKYYVQMADAAEPGLLGLESAEWQRRLRRDNDNLRAALARAFDKRNLETACRMTVDLRWFWIEYGMIGEADSWLERALASRGRLSNKKLEAQVLDASGEVLLWIPDLDSARQRFEESLALSRSTRDKKCIAWETSRLGITLTYQEDSRGLALLEEGVALARQVGDKFVIGIALMCLGEHWRQQKDDARAVSCYEECLKSVRESGPAFLLAAALLNFASVSLRQGKEQQAEDLMLESMSLAKATSDSLGMLYALVQAGGAAIARGRYERAIRLLGAVAGVLKVFGIELQPTDREDWELNVAAARAKLSATTFDVVWNEGRAMTLEEAVNYALKRDPG